MRTSPFYVLDFFYHIICNLHDSNYAARSAKILATSALFI